MWEIVNIIYSQIPKSSMVTFLVRKVRNAGPVKTLKACDVKAMRPV